MMMSMSINSIDESAEKSMMTDQNHNSVQKLLKTEHEDDDEPLKLNE